MTNFDCMYYLEMCMENFRSCMAKFVKIETYIQVLYVAGKKFAKVPSSSQNFMHVKFYMHYLKTCKKCQPTKTFETSMHTQLGQEIFLH